MFTGLIQSIGTLLEAHPLSEGKRIVIGCEESFAESINIGDSISVEGICSTVVQKTPDSLHFDYLPETLSRTTASGWELQNKVNLEKCLTPSDPIGGHFVTGHIDDVGTIKALKHMDPFSELTITYSEKYLANLVEKGSIAVDGISLTVGQIEEDTFTCYIIPHTMTHTSLFTKKAGSQVNLEFDILGKHVIKALSVQEKQ